MICLTFDTDHLDEVRMSEFVRSVDIPGQATFFCTQRYESLDVTEHELCPHPYLAENDWNEELLGMRKLFPRATGWRSHSCIFSHLLAEWVGKNGYAYVSTYDQFLEGGLKPHKMAWGIWQVPIYYMDNMDLSWESNWISERSKPFRKEIIERAMVDDGLYVFDFHPIHLMLNTHNMEHYYESRDAFISGGSIKGLRSTQYGVYDFYRELCDVMSEREYDSIGLSKALFLNNSGEV